MSDRASKKYPWVQLPEHPVHENDPRWDYPKMTKQRAYASWPCTKCFTRRDEHADQAIQSAFPELDITDHPFEESL